MNWENLDKNAMCYNCFHKKICKTVYQTNDLSIQQHKWNCSCYLNNGEVWSNLVQSVMTPEQLNEVLQNMVKRRQEE